MPEISPQLQEEIDMVWKIERQAVRIHRPGVLGMLTALHAQLNAGETSGVQSHESEHGKTFVVVDQSLSGICILAAHITTPGDRIDMEGHTYADSTNQMCREMAYDLGQRIGGFQKRTLPPNQSRNEAKHPTTAYIEWAHNAYRSSLPLAYSAKLLQLICAADPHEDALHSRFAARKLREAPHSRPFPGQASGLFEHTTIRSVVKLALDS